MFMDCGKTRPAQPFSCLHPCKKRTTDGQQKLVSPGRTQVGLAQAGEVAEVPRMFAGTQQVYAGGHAGRFAE